MLVLDRPPGTAVRIGENIQVVVRSVKGGCRVKLGIKAPPEVPIWREELAGPQALLCRQRSPVDFRVLVVEDDPDHAELIRLALSDRGISQVSVIDRGDVALQLLGSAPSAAQKPDLILLDLRLPGISGLEVLRGIRVLRSLRTVPVVILSCSGEDAEVAHCLDTGASAFVAKAAEYESFRDSIGRIADFWSHTRHVA